VPHPEDELRRAVARLVTARGQAAVAEAIGVNQSTLSRYLLGQQRLTMTLAVGLGRAFPDLRARLVGLVSGENAGEDPASVAAS
jgi:plasmid maintenance system antidote protein VapI